MKQILGIHSAAHSHWVGDGFPVRSIFAYHDHGAALSPFLLLDYAGPVRFPPAREPRGVGEHPHRGFETVTIVYDGEVEHRDSTGAGGRIGPGDVQWMTAAGGILHDEFHSREFTRNGGTLEMVQLWVNLPAKHKMNPPGYQTLTDLDIPRIELPEGAGTLRVIAGTHAGTHGPARTHTSMDVLDVRLHQGKAARFAVTQGRTFALVILRGSVRVNGNEVAHEAQLVLFDRDAGEVSVEGDAETVFLVLGGDPIDEPIVGYGPFVMNSKAEIRQAIEDFNSGLFGAMPPAVRDADAMSA